AWNVKRMKFAINPLMELFFFKALEASEKHKRKQSASKLNMTENSKAYLKGYIKCFDCNKICNSPITYENHLQGKLHKDNTQRKLYNVRNNYPVPSPNSALQNPMEWNSETLKKYYCDICKRQCGSRIPYELHILSRAHCKKAGNAEINTKVANIEETNSFWNTGAISTTDEVDNINKAKSSKYYYNLIRPTFPNYEVKCMKHNNSGLQSFHFQSTNHEKKPNSEFNSSTIESSKTPFKCYKICANCDKIFNGPVPYEQHFQGKAHKKTIGKKSIKNVGIDSLLLTTDSTLQNSMDCKKAGNAEINTKVANIEESGLCSSSKSFETNSFWNTGAISTTDEVDNINKAKSSKYYYNLIHPTFPNYEVKCMKHNNSGLQSFHFQSTNHEKKPNSEFNSSTIESSKTPFKCYKGCVNCDKIFNGPVTYEQHFQVKAHKKTIEEKFMKNVGIDSLLLATDSTLQNSMQYNSGDVKKNYCEICEKQCTGPMQYEAHILSIAHLRNLRNSELN
ncbi:c2H2-type domain-containing protein, partial [Trichonephila inaurata madagascariensis]